MKKLIVVNKQDKILGYESWQECHSLKGLLHRAFSIFIFNDKDELLLQKRSQYKPLWPLYWSNTCCSHPRKGEKIREVAKRRLKEELGFTTLLKEILKFSYRAVYKDKGSENEVCYVLVGEYTGQKIKPNKQEVIDYNWVKIDWLKKDLKQNSDFYTPWFKKIIKDKKFAEYLRIICGK